MSIVSDITVRGYGIGSIVLFCVGAILIVGLIYWLMGLVKSPPWMYTVAAVVGVLIAIVIVVAVFF